MEDENNSNAQNNTNASGNEAQPRVTHWTSGLSEEHRGHFTGRDVNEVAKEYIGLLDKTRTPMSLEGYNAYEGKEDVSQIKAIAHKIGLTNSQYKGLVEETFSAGKLGQKKALENVAADKAKVVEALKKEWGKDFETNVKNAGAVVNLLPPEMKEMITKKGENGKSLADNPAVIKLFHVLHQSVREDAFVSGVPAKGGPKMHNGRRQLSFKK
jgi:hypothetical protein